MRISPSLRLSPLWPALTALLVAALLLSWLLPRLLRETAADNLHSSLETLSPLLQEQFEHAPTSPQSWMRDLAAERRLRITLVASDGEVLADSQRTATQLAAMDNHATRPEIAHALASGHGTSVRSSATTGLEYVYVAQTVTLADGRLLVVRLAQPLGELGRLTRRLAASLCLALAAALAALALTVWWLNRRLYRPLTELIATTHRLADDQVTRPLDVPATEELSSLAVGLKRVQRHMEELESSRGSARAELRAVLRAASDGVLLVGSDGRPRLANRRFHELFDTGQQESDRPPEIARYPELERPLAVALQGEARGTEIELAGGRSLAIDCRPLEAGGVMVVARDISEIRHQRRRDEDFLANVSHELKTPVAAIRGSAETLLDGALSDTKAAPEFTRRILAQCDRLQGLLEDLLFHARFDLLGRQARLQRVDLDRLLDRALAQLAEQAESKVISVRCEGQAAALMADPQALERMLVNLLDNAIKYNRSGGEARVSLSATSHDVTVEVTDTGSGIPAHEIPRIFERFYRVEKGRGRGEGGTGLGLAIVQQVVRAHGGEVEVESEPGSGSTFRVRLPRRDQKSTE